MLETIKPWARAVKFASLYRHARRLARQADRTTGRVRDSGPDLRLGFLFGCGRSGTTILGKVFAFHPEVCYLFEPYHRWAAIDPRTDLIQLYVARNTRCILDESDCDDTIRRRFSHLIAAEGFRRRRSVIIEKTPINAMRIGYLNGLAPNAKCVHIVRDGVDVCRSIHRLASTNTYRIAGKPRLNQWWGMSDIKWKVLVRDGAAGGYYPEEVARLKGHDVRGAYEWLVTLHEVDRWRQCLGERIFELTYEQLTRDATGSLTKICRFLGVSTPGDWIRKAADAIDADRHNRGEPLRLPIRMAGAFNQFQERYGFSNRVEGI